MPNLSAYWTEVRRLRESLPPVVFVTTSSATDGRVAGGVSEGTACAMAEHLVSGTVRLSTPEEIAEYHAEQNRRREVISVRSDALCGKFRFNEIEAGVRAAAAAVAPTRSRR